VELRVHYRLSFCKNLPVLKKDCFRMGTAVSYTKGAGNQENQDTDDQQTDSAIGSKSQGGDPVGEGFNRLESENKQSCRADEERRGGLQQV